MIKLKDKIFRKYRASRAPDDWISYKKMKNQVTNAISREKKAYLEYFINSHKFENRLLWKKLSELGVYGGKSNRDLPDNLNRPDDINKNFLKSSRYIKPDQGLLEFYNNSRFLNFAEEFYFTMTTQVEVLSVLSSMKSNVIGPDQLNVEMIRLCCPYILPFLVNIINSCIFSSVFPAAWKISKVLPLPKRSDPNNLNDLRPISILPVCSKVLEKICAIRIREHLRRYNILPERQSGFRKCHSCCTALLDVVDNILSCIDGGETCALILLDYSKAFDTINHEILLAILRHIGFSAVAVSFIGSYLEGRQQYVETDRGTSGVGNVDCGVPQGSVLGPLLFCIYTIYITCNMKFCREFRYADDTQILHSFLSSLVRDANNKINHDLDSLVQVSRRHQLTLNPLKTKVMIFGKNRDAVSEDMQIILNGERIQCVDECIDLGVLIDKELRFSGHVQSCIQKAYASLRMLYPHRHSLSAKLKILLTDALVLSHFNYCDAVYGPCLTRVDCDRIQRVQRSCLRFIYGIRKYDPVIHKLKTCKWLDMESRRELHAAVLFHSVIINKCPPYLYNKVRFRTDVHSLNLRFRGLLSPPQHSTASFTRSFSYRIYLLYNRMPVNFKSLRLASFRRNYMEWLRGRLY